MLGFRVSDQVDLRTGSLSKVVRVKILEYVRNTSARRYGTSPPQIRHFIAALERHERLVTEVASMSTITWLIPTIWIAAFVSGYGLRSYVSYRRRTRSRRSRYERPSVRRTLAPIEEPKPAELAPEKAAPLVPVDSM